MELKYLFNSLPYIKPELILAASLVIIVVADLIITKKKELLHYIALAGIIAAGYFVLEQFSMNAFAFSSSGNKGMLTVDSMGAFFKGLVLTASFFVFLFSFSSNEINESRSKLGEYYALLFGMILGMFFMISASDLILVYVSMELVSLSSYVLAGITKQSLRNSEASLKYLIYGAVSSGIMLFGISLIFGITGSTNLYEINYILRSPETNRVILLLAGLLVFTGIGYKISAAPFHFWTPDVYEGAPITITAFLSVASKSAGFVLLIRFIKVAFIQNSLNGYWQLLPAVDWKTILLVLSILTMTLGNFAALWQDNLKRMLAYSSIAHAGYMLAAMAVLSNQGLIAILIYFAIYLFMNLGAFFVVMLISNKIGSEEIDNFDGLGYASPFLGVSFAIFLVSLTGLPPTAGFIGKLYIFIALVDAKMFLLSVIMVLNSVVSLYYYMRVLKHLFLRKAEGAPIELKVSFPNAVVLLMLVIPVLVLGLYFTPLVEFAKNSISVLGF
jgi:NADH-quinone oxidoreductase subunit N